MKRAIKRIGKCLIIYIVIFMLFLSNVGYCGYTQEEVGDAIAGYAAHIAITYKDKVEYSQGMRSSNPIWSENSYSWDTSDKYYFDCSSFASGCYHAVTGLFDSAQCTSDFNNGFSSNPFEKHDVKSVEDMKIGDLLFWDGDANVRSCSNLYW